MAEVVIRLKRMGTNKRPRNRIVVIPKTRARDGRALEELGTYNPIKNPPEIHVNLERAQYWISKGAIPSPAVKRLMRLQKSAKENNQ